MERLDMQSMDKVDENVRRIGALFPNCVVERKNEAGQVELAIDFDLLRQELSRVVVEGPQERYQFTWPEKRKAILAANASISDTLRPCREESVDFDTTENLYIEGDNLAVLKLLQETYLGKVKMIYIDPPYNTGSDAFTYDDDFAISIDEYAVRSGKYDDVGNLLFDLRANGENNGRFHTDWLNMIYPRLRLAKDLLSEDGIIFISIDDNEKDNLKKVCDEIFGESNFITCFIWEKTQHFGRQKLNSYSNCDYILCYSKELGTQRLKELLVESIKTELQDAPLYNASNNVNILHFPALSTKFNMPDGVYASSASPDYELLDSVTVIDGRNSNEFRLKFRSRWSNETVQREIEKGTTFWVKTESFAIRAIYGGGRVSTNAPRQIIFTNSSNPMQTKDRFGSRIDTSENASNSLQKLFGEVCFAYPKPVSLIKYLCSMLYCEETGRFHEDSFVLDFFSGSATTAHAVMQLNAEDGGHRKFIMVQLPEACDPKSEAFKAGYRTICEIGKERIRRAGRKILAEQGMMAQGLDVGFRVLKLASSNMQDVYYTPDEYTFDLLASLEGNIKPDRTPEDLLFQVMLDLGVLLSSKIEVTTVAGKRVFNVADGYLMACFDENVTEEVVTAIAKQKPYYFVMRDSSMASDSMATNFDQIFITYSPETERRVL